MPTDDEDPYSLDAALDALDEWMNDLAGDMLDVEHDGQFVNTTAAYTAPGPLYPDASVMRGHPDDLSLMDQARQGVARDRTDWLRQGVPFEFSYHDDSSDSDCSGDTCWDPNCNGVHPLPEAVRFHYPPEAPGHTNQPEEVTDERSPMTSTFTIRAPIASPRVSIDLANAALSPQLRPGSGASAALSIIVRSITPMEFSVSLMEELMVGPESATNVTEMWPRFLELLSRPVISITLANWRGNLSAIKEFYYASMLDAGVAQAKIDESWPTVRKQTAWFRKDITAVRRPGTPGWDHTRMILPWHTWEEAEAISPLALLRHRSKRLPQTAGGYSYIPPTTGILAHDAILYTTIL